MIIIKNIIYILYFTQIRHTDDFPLTDPANLNKTIGLYYNIHVATHLFSLPFVNKLIL